MKNNRMASLRKERGMTQEVAAKRLKIARSTFANYENGIREPDNETLKQIADFYEVSIDYLLGRADERHIELSEDARKIIDSLDLSDEEIVKTLKLEIDGVLLTPEQVKAFVNYVRVDRAMMKQVPISETDNR